MTDVSHTLHAKPLGVSQLILVNKAVHEKGQLEKGMEEEDNLKTSIKFGCIVKSFKPRLLARWVFSEFIAPTIDNENKHAKRSEVERGLSGKSIFIRNFPPKCKH
jgi:hypothetical protein